MLEYFQQASIRKQEVAKGMVTTGDSYTLASLRKNPHVLHTAISYFFPTTSLTDREADWANPDYQSALNEELGKSSLDPEVDQRVVARNVDELKTFVVGQYRGVVRCFSDEALLSYPMLMQRLALACIKALRERAQKELEDALVIKIAADANVTHRKWLQRHASIEQRRHLDVRATDDESVDHSGPLLPVIKPNPGGASGR